ncbi:MAG: M20/M25/M40 family metallo-hydrolase [Clostridia bacterium]|nr:M20/M25/M40 family metallo-hydrolase [Clostridia bacterium]
MFWFWLGLVAIIAACVAIVVVRTRKFVPAPEEAVSAPEEAFDTDRLRDDLQELIRCRTVSYRDRELEDESQFTLVTDALPRLFPQVFAVCELHRPNDRSVLLHWRGKSSEKPTVLMAHYDVVPVDEKAWERPPFDAVVEDGVMWGRGTLDTKGTLVSVLEAADTLIAEGFVPEHDIWMAFAGDEEIAGGGAPANVAWLTEHDVKPYLVLDEGGAVVDKVFPGVDRP